MRQITPNTACCRLATLLHMALDTSTMSQRSCSCTHVAHGYRPCRHVRKIRNNLLTAKSSSIYYRKCRRTLYSSLFIGTRAGNYSNISTKSDASYAWTPGSWTLSVYSACNVCSLPYGCDCASFCLHMLHSEAVSKLYSLSMLPVQYKGIWYQRKRLSSEPFT